MICSKNGCDGSCLRSQHSGGKGRRLLQAQGQPGVYNQSSSLAWYIEQASVLILPTPISPQTHKNQPTNQEKAKVKYQIEHLKSPPKEETNLYRLFLARQCSPALQFDIYFSIHWISKTPLPCPCALRLITAVGKRRKSKWQLILHLRSCLYSQCSCSVELRV